MAKPDRNAPMVETKRYYVMGNITINRPHNPGDPLIIEVSTARGDIGVQNGYLEPVPNSPVIIPDPPESEPKEPAEKDASGSKGAASNSKKATSSKD